MYMWVKPFFENVKTNPYLLYPTNAYTCSVNIPPEARGSLMLIFIIDTFDQIPFKKILKFIEFKGRNI